VELYLKDDCLANEVEGLTPNGGLFYSGEKGFYESKSNSF
jgi:hypothetical protein